MIIEKFYHTRASLYGRRIKPGDRGSQEYFPDTASPMLHKEMETFDKSSGRSFYVSWNGCRTIGMKKKRNVQLLPREAHDQFYPIYDAFTKWDVNIVVDGEIVALDKNGKPIYGPPTNWERLEDGNLIYFVYDLLWLDGYSLKGAPLAVRQDLLKENLPLDAPIRLVQEVNGKLPDVMQEAKNKGIQKLMHRNILSHYVENEMNDDWVTFPVI